MNIKVGFFLTAMIASFISCQNAEIEESVEGDRIELHKKGGSRKINDGDMLTLDMKITTALDSIFRNTWMEGKPIQVPARRGEFKGSFENALFQLNKGDSATVYISADSLFGRMGQPLPPGVPLHSDLKFLVCVQDVQSVEEFQEALEEKRLAEEELISNFVTEKYPKAKKLESGIFILTEKEGSGATPEVGDIVSVSYVGRFFDGGIFDQNNPFEFPVGVGRVIRGWDEALMGMKVGQKSTFIIPSNLGYGERGAGASIPPYTPLVFDIELFEIGRK